MEATVPKAKYDELVANYNVLKHELETLKRLIFASKSERHVPTADEQMSLWNQEEKTGQTEAEKQTVTYQRGKQKKAHPGRAALPEHLPVRRQVIEPDEDTTGMVEIGQDVTRKVEYIPGELFINEYVRPRYARPESEQIEGVSPIVQASPPEQALPKSIAGTGLLVQLLVAKYIDHLPLYRQQAMFKRDYEWTIATSTLSDWVGATCKLLEPLYAALKMRVLDTNYLQGDESRITVLERGKEKPKVKSHRHPPAKNTKVHLGYMWVFRNPVVGGVYFAYRPGRGANVLHDTLSDFTGYLQSDGYSAYTSFMKKHPGVRLVSCLAHIRRKFFDARSNHPELAEAALGAFKYLYRIEGICRRYDLDATARLSLRQRYARPAYAALLEWVDHHQLRQLSKSGIGKALGYAANHLPRLGAYLEDGRLEIDNNQIENKIRPLALGRKNYLFAGSQRGAKWAAMLYSIFATCKEHGVNPRTYLTDVLLRIREVRPSRMHTLLPGTWAAERAAAGIEEE